MRRTAAEHGLEYSGRARQFEPRDFQRFDLIVAMDRSNERELLAQADSEEEQSKVQLLRTFDPEGSGEEGVPDPYYGGPEGFERTYHIVERSLRGLLDALERGEV
jgi:protein-tyrosine phosphatase